MPVSGTLTPEEFQARFGDFPDADLIAELRPPSVEVLAEAVSAGIEWLSAIDQQYFPSEPYTVEEGSAQRCGAGAGGGHFH
jgi:hypothetical protein